MYTKNIQLKCSEGLAACFSQLTKQVTLLLVLQLTGNSASKSVMDN